MKKLTKNAVAAAVAAAIPAQAVLDAAQQFIARRDRLEHPGGEIDNAKRFWPADDERCACCDSIRSPSRAYPWSYMTHCRTAEHVAALHDVDAKAVRAVARELDHDYDYVDTDELMIA